MNDLNVFLGENIHTRLIVNILLHTKFGVNKLLQKEFIVFLHI